MPLYVVRWPNLSAVLFRAEGAVDLIEFLDEAAIPSGWCWEVYRGPLVVEFELAASNDVEPCTNARHDFDDRPIGPARIRIVGVDEPAVRKAGTASSQWLQALRRRAANDGAD